ncbi:putative RSM27 Mitochondrial ribosomal protein, small subunit [Teratosphaeria destructans]|uniref:Small ribosomal subunit protein mS33 n=1 Tax=Teratosphaeria destructans TaxID=418781 RepID=A0A9W7W1Y7_9PEZI|nr:putative RSM27 Mitochondrial ribosomal protein, small subunit [Teratosphaeria destructans]
MAVPRQRILDLMKACFHLVSPDALSHQLTPPCQVQCRIFSTVFNPTHQRLGNKILRQRLKGPSLAAYYPRRTVTFRDLKKTYPGFDMYDEVEEDRLDHITMTKARGKGAPKKKRSAAESRSRKGGKKR